jgi:hypothetical protein
VVLAQPTYLALMFKKKPPKLDDFDTRRDDLQARLVAAEDRFSALRADAVAVASSDPDKLVDLAHKAATAEFEATILRDALKRIEQEAAQAAEAARREVEKRQRQQTSHELRKLATDLEKAVAPVPDALLALKDAIAAALPVIGPNGLADLLGNLRVEIPPAVELFAAEIRARADQTLAGTAPPTMPAPPALTVIAMEPLEMPETSIFSLERLSWLDDHGARRNCGAFEIHGLPTRFANIALERGLAILPDSDRYKAMRVESVRTGWPHQLDTKTYDLDRDPNMVAVYSSGGKKVREEQTFTRIDRGPPRQVFVTRPPEPEQF